jgi:hypothetical protein
MRQGNDHPNCNQGIQDCFVAGGELSTTAIATQKSRALFIVPTATYERRAGRRNVAD